MIQQVSPKEVYLKITNACEQLQTQYEQWISYGQNDSTGLQYAPMFAFLILPFYQAVVTCKDLERLYPQQLEQISGLIQLMDEIIQSLHDNTQKFYTYGAGLGTGTQMAAQLTFAMTKVEELKIKALSLQLLPSEVQQFKHLRCAQNHWLQFEDTRMWNNLQKFRKLSESMYVMQLLCMRQLYKPLTNMRMKTIQILLFL
ncbi:hypothetical protein pb186bvf_013927 [Paramecium bursaria]